MYISCTKKKWGSSMHDLVNLSCSVELWVNERRIKKDGTVRLYLRISVEKHLPRDMKLRFHWPHKFYDREKREIKPRSKNDRDFVAVCAAVESDRAKYWHVIKKMILNDQYFTPDDIVREVWYAKVSEKFADYIILRSRARVKDKDIKIHTRDNHISTANSINGYKSGGVRTADLSKRWMELYQNYLLESMTYSAAWSHLKNIRTYIHDAVKKGVSIHPTFKEFKLQKPESDPVWLDKDELQKLIDLYADVNMPPVYKDYLKAFLFACFTGLRISDLKRFDNSWIISGEIVFEPVKKRITDRKPHIVKIPIIPLSKQFLMTLKDGEKMVERSDVKFNKALKVIARMAGVDKNLTTHVGRHTFGTLLAIQNTPIAVIANLMGHKTLKSTMIYIHIAEQVRMSEMQRLQQSFSSFVVHRNVG